MLFISLLAAQIVKNNHILAGIYFIFLKKTSQTKIESLSVPNLDLSESVRFTEIVKLNQVLRGLGKVRSKNVFAETIMDKLAAQIVKNSHILAEIYFIFLKKHFRLNLKVFQYQIQTSVKRSGKQLSSKTNFNTFSQLNSSSFSKKLC